MTPPKPPRKSLMMKTGSYDVPQPVYVDPDSTVPEAADENQSEVKVRPVPRPRSKFPRAQSQTDNPVDSADKTSKATNEVSSQHSEESAERPRPARPPPRPPLARCWSTSKLPPVVDRENQYMSSNTEPNMKPPAIGSERKPKLCPERPPLPAIYCDRASSLKEKHSKDISTQDDTAHSNQPTPDLLSFSEEDENLCGIYGEMATDATDRPAVPPRLRQRSLPCFYSESDSLSLQSRTPPPSFNPPSPPLSTGYSSESFYSELEPRPYLDVLPEDEDSLIRRRSTATSGQRFPSRGVSSGVSSGYRQMSRDTDDIIGMLRWLTRVSKCNYMTPSLYGLSIEEEIRSFDQRARDMSKALRLYNLLLMKRNETLHKVIVEFISISNALDKMKKKAKSMGIAGGTTGAVGGVTAVLGIALAPVTMGASLIATAVGAGMVASAGGMGAHTAKANKKVVKKMQVEKLVYEYKSGIVDVELCLDFILSGMNELRRHDIGRIHRAGSEPDAVKMAHLSQTVLNNNMSKGRSTSAAHPSSEGLLLAFAKELDQYFTDEEGQKLRKSSKSRFSGRVRLLAKNLQDQLEYLNHMWEMFG
ncbi:uncharacterized protein LOC128459243 [Pleuronectes platessa]|uniref:uncharacterized protein LOC128459243 n=1 Tax=Pleuronectes platessa TaxID=8262 RepID=UPI00232A3B9F|nr:uncharacterized protein LOC128459243 [Pleuronectes platessa]XP_053300337.1 uncharacterized protein LOC128459243 [Pleuronectes platessa]